MRAIVLLILTGCPALSDADLQRRIDRDGDRVVAIAFGGLDCDDTDPTIHPGAEEVCDGVDNDCDGLVNAADLDMPDERVGWYLDADGDGVGRDDGVVRSCATLPGYVHIGGDCDDADSDQRPDQTWYLDGDGDGWGLLDRPRVQCERPSAYALTAGDCNDANGLIHPDALEVCNTFDDDCNGPIDEADPGVVGVQTWYVDSDGDDYGAVDSEAVLCFPAPTDVLIGGDCDDVRPSVHPGSPDAWYDDVDADCSGTSDHDQDGDGIDAPSGGGLDCDDLRPWVYPGAPEICDGAPNACDDLTWVPSDEDALAHFVPTSGLLPTDAAPLLTTGGSLAVVEDGVLFLCAGDWTGQVVVTGGTVTVGAPAGPGTASLDAGGVGPAIAATGVATSLTVDGVDLKGGTGLPGAATLGGCLYTEVAAVTVRDAALTDCSADFGGGAWVHASGPVVLERVTVVGAVAIGNGGGVHLAGGAGSRVGDSRFEGCAAGQGGGMYLQAPGAPGLALMGNTFEANTATEGGGLYFASGAIDATGGAFTDNVADAGGGLYALGDAQLLGTAFLRNDADAVFIDLLGTVDATNCDLGTAGDDNTADVVNSAGAFPYGSPATFQCDRTACL